MAFRVAVIVSPVTSFPEIPGTSNVSSETDAITGFGAAMINARS
jgi:hypothetical protein